MASDLHNLNDALAELEKLSIKTTAGAFVKVEDVRRLLQERSEVRAVETETAPRPKTMEDAKKAIMQNKELMAQFPKRKPEPGRAVPAQVPQSPSRA